MNLLDKETIFLINEKTVRRHGGNFIAPHNLLNEGSLDYLIEAIEGELFGEKLYPTLATKAAFYMFQIVTGHVFQDGNKRTGLAVALLFLKRNKHQLKPSLERVSIREGIKIPEGGNSSNDILFSFTLEMAAGKIDFDQCKLWFEKNIVPIEN